MIKITVFRSTIGCRGLTEFNDILQQHAYYSNITMFSTHTLLQYSVNHWVLYSMSWPFTWRMCYVVYPSPLYVNWLYFFLSLFYLSSPIWFFTSPLCFGKSFLSSHLCLPAVHLVVLFHIHFIPPSPTCISHRGMSFLHIPLCYPLHGLLIHSEDGVTLFVWNGAISTRIYGVTISNFKTYQHMRDIEE